jgi:hypothetical protein
VLLLDLGGVSSLGFNDVPVHVPSGWPSVDDDEAFWCFVGWGCLGHYPVGRLLVVGLNYSWSLTLIRNHQHAASAVVSSGFHHMGHANMTNDMFWASQCNHDGGFWASH